MRVAVDQFMRPLSSMVHVSRCGFLNKLGKTVRSWKRRWMVLQGGLLYYYASNEPSEVPMGIIYVEDCQCVVRKSERGKGWTLDIRNTGQRTWILHHDDKETVEGWRAEIEESNYQALQGMLGILKSKCETLEVENRDQKSELSSLREENDSSKTSVAALNKENEQLKADLKTKTNDYEDLLAKYQSTTENMAEMRNALNTYDLKNRKLISKSAELSSSLATIKDSLARVKSENSNLESILSETRRSLNDEKTSHDSLKLDYRSLKGESIKLGSNLKNREDLNDRLRLELETMRQRLEVTKSELESTASQLQKTRYSCSAVTALTDRCRTKFAMFSTTLRTTVGVRDAGKTGYLEKMGNSGLRWPQRWFVVSCHKGFRVPALYYYEKVEDAVPRGVIPLLGAAINPGGDKGDGTGHVIQVAVDGEKFYLAARTKKDRDDWIEAMVAAQTYTSEMQHTMDALFEEELHNKYFDLMDVILSPDYTLTAAIYDLATGSDVDILAKAMLFLYRTRGRDLDLVEWAIHREVAASESHATAFRRNSMASKQLAMYSRAIGSDYLDGCLRSVMEELTAPGAPSLMIDPTRLKENENLFHNREALEDACEKIISSVLHSMDSMPEEFLTIIACIRDAAEATFCHSPSSHAFSPFYCVAGGFLFLRFICPAIVSPHTHNLLKNPPTPDHSKGLILVAKAIQNLANGIEFGQKESYMMCLNPFINRYRGRVCKFFDTLAERAPPLEPETGANNYNNGQNTRIQMVDTKEAPPGVKSDSNRLVPTPLTLPPTSVNAPQPAAPRVTSLPLPSKESSSSLLAQLSPRGVGPVVLQSEDSNGSITTINDDAKDSQAATSGSAGASPYALDELRTTYTILHRFLTDKVQEVSRLVERQKTPLHLEVLQNFLTAVGQLGPPTDGEV